MKNKNQIPILRVVESMYFGWWAQLTIKLVVVNGRTTAIHNYRYDISYWINIKKFQVRAIMEKLVFLCACWSPRWIEEKRLMLCVGWALAWLVGGFSCSGRFNIWFIGTKEGDKLSYVHILMSAAFRFSLLVFSPLLSFIMFLIRHSFIGWRN